MKVIYIVLDLNSFAFYLFLRAMHTVKVRNADILGPDRPSSGEAYIGDLYQICTSIYTFLLY